MNEDHKQILVDLCKHFGGYQEANDVRLENMDSEGMTIVCDKGSVRVPFLAPVKGDSYKDAIMDLLGSLNLKSDFSKISEKMVKFIDDCKCVFIASDADTNCVVSYLPFVRIGDEIYGLISEVPAHYKSIFAHPQKVQIMFIEDESTATTIFARARVGFNAKASLCDERRDEIVAKLKARFPNESPLNMLEKMSDFHAIKFEINSGRLVFGFGAAYDTDKLVVLNRAGDGFPHKR